MELNKEQIIALIQEHAITKQEVIEQLGITRQRFSTLMKEERLKPIIENGTTLIFLKEDVEVFKKELLELRHKYRPYE